MSDSGTILRALLDSLWLENSWPGRVIICCILVLLVRAILAARHHSRRYRQENANLDRVIARLEQWRAGEAASQPPGPDAPAPDPGAPPVPETGSPAADATTGAGLPGTAAASDSSSWRSLARPRAHAAADVESLREGVDRSSLIWERLEAIAKMRRYQVKINLATLQQLTLAKEAARRGMSMPAFAAGTAMMLGLLGTFIGLAIMAQRIYFALPGHAAGTTVDSWTSAFENVTAVLAGIKIAFSTSLVGIFCATVVSVFGYRLRQEQSAYWERLERFTAEDLLPATVPSVEDESLLERVTLQIENAFLQLDDVFQQNSQAIKEMTGAQEAFVEIVEEIRLITKSEASRNLEGIVEQVAAANRSMLKLVEQIPKMGEAFERGQRRLADRLAERLTVPVPAAPHPLGISPRLAALVVAAVAAVIIALRLLSR